MPVFKKNKIFDVIIAGGGPAGCVLASRLSEEPDKEILLVEAGPDAAPGCEHPDVLDPFPVSAGNPTFHWPGLVAETGADLCDGSARETRPYIQGYGVGGASNINGMGADRGLPEDFDEWLDAGAEGWAWKDVLPYFRKLEHDLDFEGAHTMHGKNGPMPVRRLSRSQWPPFARAVGDALERRGMAYIEDYNADFREGFSGAPTNSLRQRRVSASMAYLTHEVRRRSNLTIVPNAQVDRIRFDERRANGAFIRMNGATTLVRCREVVLSCGAIQTPALLMRSGAGPRDHLERHGIDVVADLPGVGANLQNHPILILATWLPSHARQAPDNPWFLQNWLRYSSNHPGCRANDMHLIPFNKGDWHAVGQRVGALAVAVFKPYSKGHIELSSPDPSVMPKVYSNLLADPRDFDRLVDGFRFILELLTDPAVASQHCEVFFPEEKLINSLSRRNTWNRMKAGCIARLMANELLRRLVFARMRLDPEKLLADERALRAFVRKHAQPEYHVCGTCRMGDPVDVETVVDCTGRVCGLEALRVVDASIFPTIPRANTHFTVLMAAEKIADAIKSQWHTSGPLSHNVPVGTTYRSSQ